MFGNVHLLFHILICFEMFKSKWQDKQFCETLLVYDIQFYHRQLYESHNLNNKIIWTISGFLTQNIAHNIKRTNYAPDATLSTYMRTINHISVYLHLFHIKYKAEASTIFCKRCSTLQSLQGDVGVVHCEVPQLDHHLRCQGGCHKLSTYIF